jgi:hypothetical protein
MSRDVRAYVADILDDEMVWAIAKRDLPLLRAKCIALLVEIEPTAGAD